MTVATWVAAVAAGWVALAVVVALRVGKAAHRADHQAGVADPRDCPPWCVRERGAALHPTRPARRGRHHLPRRVRTRLRKATR